MVEIPKFRSSEDATHLAMAQRKTKRQTPRPAWSMFPLMHDNVSRLLSDDGINFTFHDHDDDISCTKAYDTCIMGRFICDNKKCRSNGWRSKKIAITIRMY